MSYSIQDDSNCSPEPLSDFENSRDFMNNRESPLENLVSRRLSISRQENRRDFFSQIDSDCMFNNNCRQESRASGMSDRISFENTESIPKVFLYRSSICKKLDSKETQDELVELLTKIESDTQDNSNSLNNYVSLKSMEFDRSLNTYGSSNYIKENSKDGEDIQHTNFKGLLPFHDVSGLNMKSNIKKMQQLEDFTLDDDSIFSHNLTESFDMTPNKIASHYGNLNDNSSTFSDYKPVGYPSLTSPNIFQYSTPSNFHFSLNSSFNRPDASFFTPESFKNKDVTLPNEYKANRPVNEKVMPIVSENKEFKPALLLGNDLPLPLISPSNEPLTHSTDFDKLPTPKLPNSITSDICTVEMSKDQNGSRLIQQKIEKASLTEITEMIAQLTYDQRSLVILVGDVFGNYVIQKFLDHGNEEHRKTLIIKISGHILDLSLQMYGCRVIQKAIECGSPAIQQLIINELYNHVLDCIKDQNGNHVIQKCIEKVDTALLDFIVDEIALHVLELSAHPYGCRVIQRILENFEDKQKERITLELFDHIPKLILDQYGNYVIQHILDHCPHSYHRKYVFQHVKNHILYLSSHKFASNVVEKCLISGDASERQELAMEIINKSVGKEDDVIYRMMKDAYANYVIQKMIDVIIENNQMDLFQSLVKKIRPHYPNLRKISYGKHIMNKIDKISKANGRPHMAPSFDSNSMDEFTFLHTTNSNIELGLTKSNSNVDLNVSKSQQVICDSLTEFPSLLCEGRLSLEPR